MALCANQISKSGRVLVLKTFNCYSVKMLSLQNACPLQEQWALSGVTELLRGDIKMQRKIPKRMRIFAGKLLGT